jgi:hypothetical protein
MTIDNSNFRLRYMLTNPGQLDAFLLEDLDASGSVSLTNNAKAVVDYMLNVYVRARNEAPRILYRDSTGRWDEMCHDGKQFTGFAPISAETMERFALKNGK